MLAHFLGEERDGGEPITAYGSLPIFESIPGSQANKVKQLSKLVNLESEFGNFGMGQSPTNQYPYIGRAIGRLFSQVPAKG